MEGLINYFKVITLANYQNLDADNLIEANTIYEIAPAGSSTYNNFPIVNFNGGAVLESFRIGSTYKFQRFFHYNSYTMYIRYTFFDGSIGSTRWTDWRKVTPTVI